MHGRWALHGWPEARIGLFVDVVVLLYLVVAPRAGWLP
jgi:hypothetical protein